MSCDISQAPCMCMCVCVCMTSVVMRRLSVWLSIYPALPSRAACPLRSAVGVRWQITEQNQTEEGFVATRAGKSFATSSLGRFGLVVWQLRFFCRRLFTRAFVQGKGRTNTKKRPESQGRSVAVPYLWPCQPKFRVELFVC